MESYLFLDDQTVGNLCGLYDTMISEEICQDSRLKLYNISHEKNHYDGRARELDLLTIDDMDFALLERQGKSDWHSVYMLNESLVKTFRDFVLSRKDYDDNTNYTVVTGDNLLKLPDYNLCTPVIIDNTLYTIAHNTYIDSTGEVYTFPTSFSTGVITSENPVRVMDTTDLDDSKPIHIIFHDSRKYNYHLRQLVINTESVLYARVSKNSKSILNIYSIDGNAPCEETSFQLSEYVEIYQ